MPSPVWKWLRHPRPYWQIPPLHSNHGQPGSEETIANNATACPGVLSNGRRLHYHLLGLCCLKCACSSILWMHYNLLNLHGEVILPVAAYHGTPLHFLPSAHLCRLAVLGCEIRFQNLKTLKRHITFSYSNSRGRGCVFCNGLWFLLGLFLWGKGYLEVAHSVPQYLWELVLVFVYGGSGWQGLDVNCVSKQNWQSNFWEMLFKTICKMQDMQDAMLSVPPNAWEVGQGS